MRATVRRPYGKGGGLRRRASVFEHAEAQQATYVAPWFVWLISAVLGQLGHTLYATSDTLIGILILFVIVLVTAGLGWAGYVSTHERSAVAIAHTLATIAIGGLWMILCVITGLLTLVPSGWEWLSVPSAVRPTLDLWFVVGIGLCVMWNMRQGQRVNEARAASRNDEITDDWAELGLAGVKGRVRRQNEYRGEGIWTLPKGMVIADVQKQIRAIESMFDFPPNSLTILPVKGKTRKVKAVVMYKNPLEGGVEWPGVEL